MEYHSAEYAGSALKSSQWPETGLPEVVFTGRSNAGKSSLINALVNRNRLAYEGKTPGKTRMLNFFRIDDRLVFADAPGYGYAKGGSMTAELFGDIMEPYFAQRKSLKAMLIVLDLRRVPNADDCLMVDFARKAHIAVIAVCTKSDKLSRSQQLASVRVIAETLGISTNQCCICSSLKKTGMDEVWQQIDRVIG